MSVKSQFLKKLQARQLAASPFARKCQADIAEFRLRMTQLYEQIGEWLMGTGLQAEILTVSVRDLLVDSGTFEIPSIVLRYEDRVVKFMPIFLYSQGITGCVDVALCLGGKSTAQGRLFMRTGNQTNWTLSISGNPAASCAALSEETFFKIIGDLLPD